MKNQFFGDRRDFFKYDLLLQLLDGVPFKHGLTLIPMLTPDDKSNDGRLVRYGCGGRRQDLYDFLRRSVEEGARDIRRLRLLFETVRHPYMPYRDDSYFTHQHREGYFAAIPAVYLKRALVFLDPDNGLEVPSMSPANAHKYVRYEEVSSLVSRMDDTSVLVVYQHLPRVNRTTFFHRVRQRIITELSIRDPLYVSDNEIAFLVMAKRTETTAVAREILTSYAKTNSLVLMPEDPAEADSI